MLLAILIITLLAMCWPQPVLIHIILTLMLALMTKTTTAIKELLKVLRERSDLLLAYLPLICTAAVVETLRQSGIKATATARATVTATLMATSMANTRWISKILWRQAEQLGDWITQQCKPADIGKRRRLLRAVSTQGMTSARTLCVMSVLAMQANTTIAKEREVQFDTDSGHIGVDSRCSACISHEATDFEEGTLKPCNRIVMGFGGSRVADVKIGTIRWSLEDDNGMTETFRIPNSYLVQAGKVRLQSPQH